MPRRERKTRNVIVYLFFDNGQVRHGKTRCYAKQITGKFESINPDDTWVGRRRILEEDRSVTTANPLELSLRSSSGD